MKITYTRVIYNCEADIPVKRIDEACDGDLDIALKALNENTGSNVEIEDIEEGELDEDDRAYEKHQEEMEALDEEILRRDYLRGLL